MDDAAPIYRSHPAPRPDDEFEPGELAHLVVGNRGRALDPRRTPVSIVDLRQDISSFVLRIDDFEDRGALWVLPFDKVDRYQFERVGPRADVRDVERMRQAVARLDVPLVIPADDRARPATEARLDDEQARADAWLGGHSTFLAAGEPLPDPDTRVGSRALQRDLQSWLEGRGLAGVEAAWARQWVSNPFSGELVKGHLIVLAELGLAAFAGRAVRDPSLFEGAGSRARRAEHLLARMGWLRALFARLDMPQVVLYRGVSYEGPCDGRPPPTLIATSFCRAVSAELAGGGSEHATRALQRQAVPVTRLVMTYLETAAMNDPFQEAEAVLLGDAENDVF